MPSTSVGSALQEAWRTEGPALVATKSESLAIEAPAPPRPPTCRLQPGAALTSSARAQISSLFGEVRCWKLLKTQQSKTKR